MRRRRSRKGQFVRRMLVTSAVHEQDEGWRGGLVLGIGRALHS
ncbi:hypothetical protein [Brevundimonas sp.]|jgi:hypothetical protein